MARVLDLNQVQGSLLDVTLTDEQQTVLHLDIPTEALVQEMQAMRPEIRKIKSGDKNAVDMLYEITARILSCNQDYITVTKDDLQSGKYKMNLVYLVSIFGAYFSAIDELAQQKN